MSKNLLYEFKFELGLFQYGTENRSVKAKVFHTCLSIKS